MTTDLSQPDPRHIAIDAALNALDSANSKRAYKRHLLDFLDWHTQQGQPPLTKSVIGAYKDYLKQTTGAASVNQALAAIKLMIAEAADNGMIDPVSAGGIAKVKGVKSEALPAGRAITSGELSALLNVCEQSAAGARDAAIIALLYSCGLRRAELVSLDLADYDPESGELKILHAKGNKQRKVYAATGARYALEDWLTIRGSDPGPLFCQIRKGGHIWPTRLTTQAVYHILQNRAEQAGVKDVTPHDFRRTLISELLDAGEDIVTVQKIAGHADVSTTARYDRRGDEAKRRAVESLHVPYRRRTLG